MKHKIYLINLILLFYSCNYDRIEIDKISYENWLEIEEDNPDNKIKINFSANILNQYTSSRTTSMSLIGDERFVTLYAYTVANESKLESVVEYKTETIGSLTPITTPMYLLPNIYSLYAVGVNEANAAVPEFENGIATDIQNGMDYIWDGLWNIDITTRDKNDSIQIEFNHCCTQILIDLVVETGIEVNSISSVTLTPPIISNLEWELFDQGNIGPATSINKNESDMVNLDFKKTAFGFRANYVMIPIKVDSLADMICRFIIDIENEDFDRTYQLNLPVYENNMESGYAYKYNITLDRDTLFYTDVEVTDWYIIDAESDTLSNE